MPFKIVQTLEGGVKKLTVVPVLWEVKGLLRWPSKNTKNPGTLIKDGNSRPGPGWSTLKCTLKRNNIRTYEEANIELNNMEQNTDTDSQENDSYGFPSPQTSKANHPARNVINFEAMANNLTNSQFIVDEVLIDNTENIENVHQNIPVVEEPSTMVQIITSDNLNTILTNQTLILNQLISVVENQKSIGKKLAYLTVQLDETNKEITQLKQIQQSDVTMLRDATVEERESFTLKPIDNLEEFEMFELNLSDKAHKKKIFTCLSTLYSSKPGEGQTCAYKLVDVLFSKEFLCHCSWSGGSKGERSKIPMINFTNFRKFFFSIINTWDPSFTDDSMIKFFKLVLRNATKRKSMQGLRESTKRVRKFKRQEQGNNEENSPEGDGNNNDGDGDEEQPTPADVNGGEPEAADVNGGEPAAADINGGEPAAADVNGREHVAADVNGGEPAAADINGGEPAAADVNGREHVAADVNVMDLITF